MKKQIKEIIDHAICDLYGKQITHGEYSSGLESYAQKVVDLIKVENELKSERKYCAMLFMQGLISGGGYKHHPTKSMAELSIKYTDALFTEFEGIDTLEIHKLRNEVVALNEQIHILKLNKS